MVKHYSIRVLINIMNKYNFELKQMNVKTMFLQEDLEETIYIEHGTV